MEFRSGSRLAAWIGIGVASVLVLFLVAVLFISQTRTGRGLVLDYTVGSLQGTLDGRIEVDRLRGNLLRGATLHGIRVTGPEAGEPFLEADSGRVAYSLRSFVLGRVVLREVVLHRPVVDLVLKPGEDFWNFQIIFGDTVPDPDRVRRETYVDYLEVHDGTVRLITPWEPAADKNPADREAEIQAAREGTSRVVVEEIPEGLVRIVRFADVNAILHDIQLAPNELGGSYMDIERFASDISVWREPARIRYLRGEIAMFDDALEFRAPEIRLPDSWISGYGRIDFDEDAGGVDVTLASDSVALADLRWLYPPLPDGGGRLTLHIESRPEGVLYMGREADIHAPGTRLMGQLGILVNDALQVVEPDLVADPLRISTVEALLPMGLPFTDLRIRRVEAAAIGD